MPLGMVPLSLQSLAVLFWAHWLPRNQGLFVVLVYLIFGIMGLPVFAEGNAGWEYFIGPSLGYFTGFLLEPLVVSQKGLVPFSILQVLFWQLVGISVILALGAFRLSLLVEDPFETGITPFIYPALIKGVLATIGLYVAQYFTTRQ